MQQIDADPSSVKGEVRFIPFFLLKLWKKKHCLVSENMLFSLNTWLNQKPTMDEGLQYCIKITSTVSSSREKKPTPTHLKCYLIGMYVWTIKSDLMTAIRSNMSWLIKNYLI